MKIGKTSKTKSPPSSVTTKTLKAISLPDIFVAAGFTQIKSEGIHFEVETRKGEIDFIFAYENLIVLCEETSGKNKLSEHFSKKRLFHTIIDSDLEGFFDVYTTKNQDFASYLAKQGITYDDVELRQLYFSALQDCDSSLFNHCAPLKILRRVDANYFRSLVKTIGRSAKYELLKYLKVGLSHLGAAKLSGTKGVSADYDAFVLSGAHINYPKGFGVASFYADPDSLISRAYVLRRDGWEDAEISYQRFLLAPKLAAMRKHLSKSGTVFVNNLIVTLPNHVQIIDSSTKKPVSLDQTYKGIVQLSLPLELGTVGIIDGQHRIFSYYEGTDVEEAKISALRKRQNLLVTAIIFPAAYTQSMRVKFEAELFLSINNTQSGVRPDLRQELEALINPSSVTAMCKMILSRLAETGPLAGLIQKSLYDPPEKIRTSSLVRYVLPSLINPGGSGSLYQLFDITQSLDLNDDGQRATYIEFCVTNINKVLLAARDRLGDSWAPRAGHAGMLSPTTIGGLILMLRDVIAKYDAPLSIDFHAQLDGLEDFDFFAYTSSSWAEAGSALEEQFFAE